MKTVWSLIAVTGVVLVGMLVYMVIDSAISLDYARASNQTLKSKCELLAKLASDGLRGHSSESIIKSMGPNVIAKIEGVELRLDDVVLRVEAGKITGVDIVETCR